MIFDCFTFRNEFEMLELRLKTLWDTVDYFILVEADKTHAGKAKPLYFEERKSEFGHYAEKIIHVAVCDMPPGDDPWAREKFQRNCIVRGLSNSNAEDWIMVSDADEIPRPEAIAKAIGSNRLQSVLQDNPIAFSQRNFYYYVNCIDLSGLWAGTVLSARKNMKSPQYLRDIREKAPRIPYGGWHFGYLGGANRVVEKINACAHQEGNTPQNNSLERVQRIIQQGRAEIQNNPLDYYFVELDASFPKPLLAVLEKYPALVRSLGKDETVTTHYPAEAQKEITGLWRWRFRKLKQALQS